MQDDSTIPLCACGCGLPANHRHRRGFYADHRSPDHPGAVRIICEVCGRVFFLGSYRVTQAPHHTCSRICSGNLPRTTPAWDKRRKRKTLSEWFIDDKEWFLSLVQRFGYTT